jgi:F420H(2)-dependent biliverdin reductase
MQCVAVLDGSAAMAFDLEHLDDSVLAFLRERHLGSLTTLRPDGSPHVVPVGFSYDHEQRTVRIITQTASRKSAHARRNGRGAVMQVDGGRWLTLEGTLRFTDDPDDVAAAVAAYTNRYQPPRSERAETRAAIELRVDRIMGRA